MKRSDIEKAAHSFKGDGIDNFRMQNRGATSPYLWSQKEMIDFAIQQVNAALEEAANEAGEYSPKVIPDRIRQMKIGKE